MSVATEHQRERSGRASERLELARYTISAGERVNYGQRVADGVRLLDVPADGRGRHYVIERELTRMAELEAIVADYLEQSTRWNGVPAHVRTVGRR